MKRSPVSLIVSVAWTALIGLSACSSSKDESPTTANEALGTVPATAPADSSSPSSGGDRTYALGQLKLGLSEAEAVNLLGEPDRRTERVEQAADGMFVSTWTWPSDGLTLLMGAPTIDGPGLVSAVTAEAPSKLTTAEGIGIGSDQDAVQTAYGEQIDTEGSGEGSIVVGSLYGGMVLEMKEGKVLSIFIGAAAE